MIVAICDVCEIGVVKVYSFGEYKELCAGCYITKLEEYIKELEQENEELAAVNDELEDVIQEMSDAS